MIKGALPLNHARCQGFSYNHLSDWLTILPKLRCTNYAKEADIDTERQSKGKRWQNGLSNHIFHHFAVEELKFLMFTQLFNLLAVGGAPTQLCLSHIWPN